mgnify:CR=1 FL=1
MLNLFKKFLSLRKEIAKLKEEKEILKLDLRHSLSITEKYLPYMRASDKLKLLVLRRKT